MLIDLLTLNSYSTADTKRQIAINIENVLSKQKLVNQTISKYLGYMIRKFVNFNMPNLKCYSIYKLPCDLKEYYIHQVGNDKRFTNMSW